MVNSEGGTATLANNVINGGSGGHSTGVYSTGTTTLANNTIDGGSGSSSSTGVYNGFHGVATLTNNTIDGGSGGGRSYGVVHDGYRATATLVNNDIWGADVDCLFYDGYSEECAANTVGAVNACAWIGCEEASGNISANPLFVNPGGK